MDWASFSMGFGLASALAAFAWIFASAVRELRAEDEMLAAAPDPALIAQSLDEIAITASPTRADSCRRLAAVLRQPGFGEVRHG